jgi:hypothetical protein
VLGGCPDTDHAIGTDGTRGRFGSSALPPVQTLLVTGSDYLLCHRYKRYS